MKRIFELYRHLEQGTTPRAELVGKDNIVGRAVAPSQRGDVIVAEHVEGDVYDVIRIEPERESHSKQIQRQIQNPVQHTTSRTRRVEGCKYLIQRIEIPELAAEGTTASPHILHRACSWRQNINKRGRAHSAEQLQRAWERWRAGDQ